MKNDEKQNWLENSHIYKVFGYSNKYKKYMSKKIDWTETGKILGISTTKVEELRRKKYLS